MRSSEPQDWTRDEPSIGLSLGRSGFPPSYQENHQDATERIADDQIKDRTFYGGLVERPISHQRPRTSTDRPTQGPLLESAAGPPRAKPDPRHERARTRPARFMPG